MQQVTSQNQSPQAAISDIKGKFDSMMRNITPISSSVPEKKKNEEIETLNQMIDNVTKEYNSLQPAPGTDSKSAISNGLLAYYSHVLLNKLLYTIPDTSPNKDELLKNPKLQEFYNTVNSNVEKCKKSVHSSPLNYTDANTLSGGSNTLSSLKKPLSLSEKYQELQDTVSGNGTVTTISLNSADIAPVDIPRVAMLLQINDPENMAKTAAAAEICSTKQYSPNQSPVSPCIIEYENSRAKRTGAMAMKYAVTGVSAAATVGGLYVGLKALSMTKLLGNMKFLPHAAILMGAGFLALHIIKKVTSRYLGKSNTLPNATKSSPEIKGYEVPMPSFEMMGDAAAAKIFGTKKDSNTQTTITSNDFKKVVEDLARITKQDKQLNIIANEANKNLVRTK
ncbi:hypothetical protein Fsol_00398 [Candidatus Fokinia solitaria]|uniref:Uncharacterized protein n=1 Tax=Candidatus Fokinia solitaria TaxID=1802984 RepID=A0A2U8BSA9_9RICK|nr:hypothetical protein [Candidatus Fokinia solitaria]AWD33195.1 hypothetical protein Fsol_00398 [Candidatus Fokinia solitaria]